MTAVLESDTETQKNEPGFVYHPKDGGEPIVFPFADVLWEDVDGVNWRVFLWRISKMRDIYQQFAFFNRANVPPELAERVLALPAEETEEFFDAWFNHTKTPKAGLSPES